MCGNYSALNAAFNNPLGSGKGFRGWHSDTTNSHTSWFTTSVTHSSNELWIRIYHRWQSGTRLGSGYIKMLYMNELGPTPNILLEMDTGGMRFLNPGAVVANFRSGGWNDIFPSGVSDGNWHCFEYYFRTGSNGAFSYWVDDVLKGSSTGISVPSITGGLSFRVNNSGFSNGTCMYEDMDDIAISTTGRIGPLGGGGGGETLRPRRPRRTLRRPRFLHPRSI